ncbi:sulfurtransferase [Lutibacter sp.]|uniref:sulfurtransferase n=1 Tax=Lutibacter sp. TaxID=1925666 RepID=UPI0027346427|nr:sulfurtransferase [Lutibacter sp.]MDP3312791.1 sulfurtransferase [Lutibacter sp.]
MNIDSLVSVNWLFQQLNNPNLIILDASPSENKSNLIPEYTDIQIKGARIFDMEKVFVDSKSEIANMFPSSEVFERECQKLGINNNSLIVVYDNLGIYTSPRAWWMFKSMGHSNIGVLDGGFSAWKNENYPTEPKIYQNFLPGNFKATYINSSVVSAEEILQNISLEESLVIDARSVGRFSGNLPEPRENMESGHIPKSINIPFEEVLNLGKMKSKEELNIIFDTHKKGNNKLIFTCGSGITACIILLASAITNANSTSLFDGSWATWGQKGKYPIAKNVD